MTDRLSKHAWFVADCPLETARRLVRAHHYARGGSNIAVATHGLYATGTFAPVGVAWWIPPTKDTAAAWWSDWQAVLTLSRLVLAPDVPKNAATFLLMRSIRLLDPRWRCLLTYADTWREHTGHIYRAAGWEYLGLTDPRPTYVINGRMAATKHGLTTWTHAEMLARGAECVGSFAKHRYRYIRPVKHNRARQAAQLELGL